MSSYSKIYFEKYKCIFEGGFVNLNEIDDFEHEAQMIE